MVERLKSQKIPAPLRLYPGNISRFEQGMRDPMPIVLLAYARAASVPVEVLIDAELELPNQLGTPRQKIQQRSSRNAGLR
jgi:hypothetical protein